MAYELTGKLLKTLPEVSGNSQKGPWVKQEFIVKTTDDYPKEVAFTAWGDKVNDLREIQAGETITVSFNPESRAFNEKWYTELRAWKIQ